MVAAVSHERASYIEWEMPLAQGLQYQAIWLELEGNETAPAFATGFDSAAFDRIAGR